jgi:hypothetical protein
MNVVEGMVVVGATAGGVWLTREVLKHADLRGAGRTISRSGTDVADRVGHLVGGVGRASGDLAEKAVSGGGHLLAAGTGAAVGLGTAAAERVLFVHRETDDRPVTSRPRTRTRSASRAA